MTLTLYELGGLNDRRYSLFSWRARYALAHKGLDVEWIDVDPSDRTSVRDWLREHPQPSGRQLAEAGYEGVVSAQGGTIRPDRESYGGPCPLLPRQAAPPGTSSTAVYNQGSALGGARFNRLEGCWYGNGAIYFDSTSGGNAGAKTRRTTRATTTSITGSPATSRTRMPPSPRRR